MCIASAQQDELFTQKHAGAYTLFRMNPPAGEVQSEDEYCLNIRKIQKQK